MTWPRRPLASSAVKAENFKGQKGSPETQHGFRSPLHWISAWSEQPFSQVAWECLRTGFNLRSANLTVCWKNSRFVSGHGFSDAVSSSKSEAALGESGVCQQTLKPLGLEFGVQLWNGAKLLEGNFRFADHTSGIAPAAEQPVLGDRLPITGIYDTYTILKFAGSPVALTRFPSSGLFRAGRSGMTLSPDSKT